MLRRTICSEWWVSAAVLCAVLVPVWVAEAHGPVFSADADRRIAFYNKRIGGAATYPAYARLGMAYLDKARQTGRRRDYSLAGRHLLTSLAYQNNFDALLGLALVCSDRHRFREGTVYTEGALALVPDHAEATGVAFDLALAVGDEVRAEELLDRLLAQGTGFEACTRQANLLEQRGDLEGALDAWRRALADASRRSVPSALLAWTHARMARLHLNAGDILLAETASERSMKFSRHDSLGLLVHVQLMAERGRAAEAMALLGRDARNQNDPELQLLRSDLYARMGLLTEAKQVRAQVARWLRTEVEEGEMAHLRVWAFLLLEDEGTAWEGLDMAWKEWLRRRDSATADLLAWAYFRTGRLREADAMSEWARAKGTVEPRILLHGAVIAQALGEKTRAAELWAQVMRGKGLLSVAEKRWMPLSEEEKN